MERVGTVTAPWRHLSIGFYTERLPFVESSSLDVGLQSFVFDDELHFLKERGRERWRLFAEEDVKRLGYGVAQLTLGADRALAAFGVFAVSEAI